VTGIVDTKQLLQPSTNEKPASKKFPTKSNENSNSSAEQQSKIVSKTVSPTQSNISQTEE
jgi:hypothetical protein